MEIKIKGGKKFKIKDISIDERDALFDSVKYDIDIDGKISGVSMMNTTITKWIRTCIDGDTSDDFLKTLSMEDRTNIFVELQDKLVLGKGKASK